MNMEKEEKDYPKCILLSISFKNSKGPRKIDKKHTGLRNAA